MQIIPTDITTHSVARIMETLRPMSKRERKEMNRARRKATRGEETIPLHERQHLRVILICQRRHDPTWRTLSTLTDINIKLSCRTISEMEGYELAQTEAARWGRHNIFDAVKVQWRYGKPMVDYTHRRPASLSTPKRTPRIKFPERTLDDLL